MAIKASTLELAPPAAPPLKGGVVPARDGVSLDRLRALPALLTPREAFEVVRVRPSTGYEWIKRGVIPVIHLGARMYVRTAALLEEVLGISSAVLFAADHPASEVESEEFTPDKKGPRS